MPRRYQMKVETEIDWVYQRMYEALREKFPSIQQPRDMAKYIDQKSHHTVFQAKSEGRVPKGYVETVAELTGRRIEWIRTGQGPVYKWEGGLADLGPDVQALITHWQGMSRLQRRLWVWVAVLLAAFEDDVLRWCEQHQELLDLRQRSTPDPSPEDTSADAVDPDAYPEAITQ